LILNLPLVGLFIKLLSIPGPLLYSGVLAFVVLGAYSLSYSYFGMFMLLLFGMVGLFMDRFDIPLGPAVLALVLEPLLETNMRRALQISGGDPMSFVERPASLVLIVVALAVVVLPGVTKALMNKRDRSVPTPV
jgi:putative tricarboxylic transport membrane protein